MPWLWGRFKDFLREDDAWLSGLLSIGSALLGLNAANDAKEAGDNAAAAALAEADYNIKAVDIQTGNIERGLETANRQRADLEARQGFTQELAAFAGAKMKSDIDAINTRAALANEATQLGTNLANAATRGAAALFATTSRTASDLANEAERGAAGIDIAATQQRADLDIEAIRGRADFDVETAQLQADADRGAALANAAQRGVTTSGGSSAAIQSSRDYLEARQIAKTERDAAYAVASTKHQAAHAIRSLEFRTDASVRQRNYTTDAAIAARNFDADALVQSREFDAAASIRSREYDAAYAAYDRELQGTVEVRELELKDREQGTAIQVANDRIADANAELQDLSNRRELFEAQGALGVRAGQLQGSSASLTALGAALGHGVNAFQQLTNAGKH